MWGEQGLGLDKGTSARCAELLAKKRKRDEQWAAERAASAVDAKKKARTTRSTIFKRAEQYVKEYRSQVPKRIPCCCPAQHPLSSLAGEAA
jgi:hypothetical protein